MTAGSQWSRSNRDPQLTRNNAFDTFLRACYMSLQILTRKLTFLVSVGHSQIGDTYILEWSLAFLETYLGQSRRIKHLPPDVPTALP